MNALKTINSKLSFSTIKDIIYIAGIIIIVIFYFRDKAKGDTILEMKIETMLDNQQNIFEKLKELDIKFEKQAELNGKVLMYIDLDANK